MASTLGYPNLKDLAASVMQETHPMDAAGAPNLNDAMTAVVGGGIALGGLLLVFVGFLFGQAAALAYSSKPAPKAITQKYRRMGLAGIIPFALSLGTAIAAILYWFFPGEPFARWVILAFAACVSASIIYGVITALLL